MSYTHSFVHPKRLLMMAFFFITVSLVACGGGSSDTDTGDGAGAENKAPTINAGADATVDAGATVTLNVEFNDADGKVVGRSFKQTAGPNVSLTATDLDSLDFTFVAPSTGTLDTVELVFEFTVTDNDGAEASDAITYTVNRVNQAPVAAAGEDQSVDGLTEVTLSGSGTDSDGTIASYAWTQTAGATVVLSNADQTAASFEAPSTTSTLTLEFTLTVTDSDGGTALDVVAVTVIPETQVDIIFPPTTGVYAEAHASSAAKISAFGTMKPGNGVEITTVMVTAGVGPVAATFDAVDGTWRVDNLQIPASVEEFTVEVTATDSAGLSRVTAVTLQTSGDSVGNGEPWNKSTAVAVDSEAGKAYVLTTGVEVSDIKLIPIDIATGERGPSITNFSDTEQGVTATAFTHMVFDKASERFFIAVSPADPSLSQIISVDLNTGARMIVSNDAIGTGDAFIHPTGLALGPDDTLFVADNGAETVFSVDIETGDRSVVGNAESSPHMVVAPSHVAWNQAGHELFVSRNEADLGGGYAGMVRLDLSVTPPAGSGFSGATDYEGPPLNNRSYGVIADSVNNRVLLMNSYQDQILSIGMIKENRTLLADDVTGGASSTTGVQHGIDYDSANELLYVVGGKLSENDALFVIDAESGDKVMLSRE